MVRLIVTLFVFAVLAWLSISMNVLMLGACWTWARMPSTTAAATEADEQST